MASAGRRRLTRADVVDTALELIDSEGVRACTMRAVAARLGVEAMSLYWHVESKQALLDAVVSRVLVSAADDSRRAAIADWQELMREYARNVRRMLHAHPNLVGLMVERAGLLFTASESRIEAALGLLEQAGFSRADAGRILRAVIRVAFGVTMVELGAGGADTDAAAAQAGIVPIPAALAVDPEVLFESVIDALIAGIEARGGLVVPTPADRPSR